MTGYTVVYTDSTVREELSYKRAYFYDSKGRNIKGITYKTSGIPIGAGTVNEYDKRGNLIKQTSYRGNGTVGTQIITTYNRYGQPLLKIRNGKINKQFSYDRKNRISTVLSFKPKGEFNFKEITKHNKDWLKTEVTTYHSQEGPGTRLEYVYDEKDNLSGYRWFNKHNELYMFSRSVFNEWNQPIISQVFRIRDKDTVLVNNSRLEYLYDEKMNYVEARTYNKEDKLSTITRIQYEY